MLVCDDLRNLVLTLNHEENHIGYSSINHVVHIIKWANRLQGYFLKA
jgi:hypothetical protein